MSEMRSGRWRNFVWLVPMLVILAGCASALEGRPAGQPGAGASSACVLVDTDAALDDLRAIAALIRNGRVVGVVATEGIASSAKGAMAISHLLAAANVRPGVAVIVGAASPAPSRESWLPEARANAERLNGFLAEAVPLPESARALEEEVERLVADCGEVRVVVLGPWTSFVRYRPRLAARLRQVVTQGLPLADVPQGRSPGFNCRYDLAACRQINESLRPAGLVVWVDVPRGVTPPYAPTTEMFGQLTPAGLPGTVRALFLGNPGGWKDTLMWDDSAVLYLLHPEAFGPKGAHVEPVVSTDEIRRLWLQATNRLN